MRQLAEVIRREDGAVWVRLDNPSKECGNCKGCVRLTGERKIEDVVLRLNDPTGAYQPGDRVFLETEGKEAFKAVTVLYGIPFAALFVGYGVTYALIGSDALAGLGAVAGLILGAFVSRPLARKIADRMKEPYISARACS
ncbi:MAG: SoxR reducing system RseC family protein [Firmicutes bacterium]|nr:SoxR reducing system RseC family protein [Bacillota bacterium]